MGLFDSDQRIVLTTVGVDKGARALLDATIQKNAELKTSLMAANRLSRQGFITDEQHKESLAATNIEMEKNKQMYRALADSAKLPTKEITDLHFGLDGISKTTMKQALVNGHWLNIQKKVTTGLKAFRMELLSVMFFGMAMQKVLGGITQSGFEMIGATDLWSNAMTMVMLPAMMQIQGPLDNMLISIMNLDETTRLFAGTAILAGQGIGTILSAFGALGLGLMGLSQAGLLAPLTAAFMQLQILVGAFGMAIGAIMAPFIAPLLIAVLAIGAAIILWETNFLGFKDGVISIAKSIDDMLTNIPLIGDAWKAIRDNILIPIADTVRGILEGLEKIYNWSVRKGFKTNAELAAEDAPTTTSSSTTSTSTSTTQTTTIPTNTATTIQPTTTPVSEPMSSYWNVPMGGAKDIIQPRQSTTPSNTVTSSSNVYLSPTYNINGIGMNEFERLLKEYGDNQTQTIKTMIR